VKLLKRYLVTDGRIGEVPHWYRIINAARYLKVAPWELAQQSAFWLHAAESAQAAEAAAQNRRQRTAG
jgi:hypothetical protein